MKLNVKPSGMDENIGVIKKLVSISDQSVTTPTKAIKCSNIKDYSSKEKINEVSKRINLDTLKNFHEKDGFSGTFCRNVRDKFSPDCFNFVFFNLTTNQFPDDEVVDCLGHVLYSASDRIICLPIVQKALLSSPRPSGKSQKIDDKKVNNYLLLQQKVIDAINLKNSKSILGVIPILAPKYTRQIIDLYFENEIFDFVIDAGTANIFNKEPDLRSILGSINDHAKERIEPNKSSLADTYIHAVNLGINNFSADEVSSDDFLSLFAYIDTFGNKFKPRGKFDIKVEPRKKVFLRDIYAYKLLDKLSEKSPFAYLKEEKRYTKITAFNEKEQFDESIKIKTMIGEEDVGQYIKSKGAISESTYKKLEHIFSKIKVD